MRVDHNDGSRPHAAHFQVQRLPAAGRVRPGPRDDVQPRLLVLSESDALGHAPLAHHILGQQGAHVELRGVLDEHIIVLRDHEIVEEAEVGAREELLRTKYDESGSYVAEVAGAWQGGTRSSMVVRETVGGDKLVRR